MSKVSKNRYWAAVVYPESAPENWVEIVRLQGLRAAISPLHDKDQNADEHEKKAHWHVILCWDSPTTANAAKSVTDKLNAPVPQGLTSVKGYYRYLTHMDNPEKYQYDPADIQHIGGFDPADYIEWSRSEIEAMKRKIAQMVRDANLTEYHEVYYMLLDSEANDLLTTFSSNTIHFNALLTSRRYHGQSKDDQKKQG